MVTLKSRRYRQWPETDWTYVWFCKFPLHTYTLSGIGRAPLDTCRAVRTPLARELGFLVLIVADTAERAHLSLYVVKGSRATRHWNKNDNMVNAASTPLALYAVKGSRATPHRNKNDNTSRSMYRSEYQINFRWNFEFS